MGRFIMLTLAIGSMCWSQSMLEHAGIAAGSTVGSVAGKQVSNGITSIMNKAAGTSEAAGKTEATATPLIQVGPAVQKQVPYNVPPPPPLPGQRQQAVQPRPEPVVEPIPVAPPPPPRPAPPTMTAASFATISQGMRRSELLNMGHNAVRIVTTQNGHVEESFHYRNGDNALGVVRLIDGKVARVDVQP